MTANASGMPVYGVATAIGIAYGRAMVNGTLQE